MIQTSRQLKDLIRNLSKEKAADAQLLMRHYMMERFLERVSISEYSDSFVLKGGMLIAAMVGLDARSTMDMDATLYGRPLSIDEAKKMIATIIAVPIKDEVTFAIKSISTMMDEAEYPGIRVGMEALFDGVVTPLKLDISTGDTITPQAVQYAFRLMLEDRSIHILAYNLETVIAEKLDTVIVRATLNTRMRDFYDLYALTRLYDHALDGAVLNAALLATAHRRGHTQQLTNAGRVMASLEQSAELNRLWEAYQKKFSYAADLPWSDVIRSVEALCLKAGLSLR